MKKVLEYVVKNLRDAIGITKASQLLDKVVIIDKVISQVEIMEVSGSKYVRKRYDKEVGIFKWLPPSLMLKELYPFTLNPKERLLREVAFFSSKWDVFNVPKVIRYDIEKLELIREYVDGKVISLRCYDEAELLGKAMAEIHSKDYALGDVKPTNFIIRNARLYVIDAEQSVSKATLNMKCWDLVCLALIASYMNFFTINIFKNYMIKFLKNYVTCSKCVEVLKHVYERYFNPLALLIPLPHIIILDNVIGEVLSYVGK